MASRKTKTGTLSRKERERAEHRREILEAAERVFAEKGYDLATVDQITRQAQFAAGTLYNFFKNKEDLYVCVIEKVVREFMDTFESQVAANKDPVAAVRALIRLHLTHFEIHRGFFRVFFGTAPGRRVDPSEAFHRLCKQWRTTYIDKVAKIFDRGIRLKKFDSLDPLYMALSLEGILHAFISYWADQEPTESLEERIARLTETFVSRMQTEQNSSGKPGKSTKTQSTRPAQKKSAAGRR